jgi:hypothetical protein
MLAEEPDGVAAKLAAVLAGESPAGGDCPMATVVISDGEEGDRIVASSEVKAAEGLACWPEPRMVRGCGEPVTRLRRAERSDRAHSRPRISAHAAGTGVRGQVRSARAANNLTGRSNCETESREKALPAGRRRVGVVESAEPVTIRRRPVLPAKALGICSWRALRGPRVQHVRKERSAKARNHSLAAGESALARASRISPNSEVAACRRVGRMGPIK